MVQLPLSWLSLFFSWSSCCLFLLSLPESVALWSNGSTCITTTTARYNFYHRSNSMILLPRPSRMTLQPNDYHATNNNNSNNHDGFDESWGEQSGVMLQDLTWRVEKLRLEEQNQQRFLKAMPRFLPYMECRKWVQALGRWKTETDWKEWIALGEKRNSYIPSEPDEYYGRLGQWISWDHFLLENGDFNSSQDDVRSQEGCG